LVDRIKIGRETLDELTDRSGIKPPHRSPGMRRREEKEDDMEGDK